MCEEGCESLCPACRLSEALRQWHVRPAGASGSAPGQQPAGSAARVWALAWSRCSCGSPQPYPVDGSELMGWEEEGDGTGGEQPSPLVHPWPQLAQQELSLPSQSSLATQGSDVLPGWGRL